VNIEYSIGGQNFRLSNSFHTDLLVDVITLYRLDPTSLRWSNTFVSKQWSIAKRDIQGGNMGWIKDLLRMIKEYLLSNFGSSGPIPPVIADDINAVMTKIQEVFVVNGNTLDVK